MKRQLLMPLTLLLLSAGLTVFAVFSHGLPESIDVIITAPKYAPDQVLFIVMVIITALGGVLLFFNRLLPRKQRINGSTACLFKPGPKIESTYKIRETIMGVAHVYKFRGRTKLSTRLSVSAALILLPLYSSAIIALVSPLQVQAKYALFFISLIGLYSLIFTANKFSLQLITRIFLPSDDEQIIFMNTKCRNCQHGRFILAHEEGHLTLDTEDELKATCYAMANLPDDDILEAINQCGVAASHVRMLSINLVTPEIWKNVISEVKKQYNQGGSN